MIFILMPVVSDSNKGQCYDCGEWYPIEELQDGSCDCPGDCVHDQMDGELRCQACFEEQEIDIVSGQADRLVDEAKHG